MLAGGVLRSVSCWILDLDSLEMKKITVLLKYSYWGLGILRGLGGLWPDLLSLLGF